MNVREPAVAGSFYPGDKDELTQMINEYLEKAEDITIEGKLRGLVEPHAGYIYSGPVAAYGYKLLGKTKDVNKIQLVGPSHHAVFNGACEAGFDLWQTPLGKVKAKSLGIEDESLMAVYPKAHAMEHCLEVQLPFLQTVMKKDFEIYPVLTGQVDIRKLGDAMMESMDDKTVFIASSDLSHYHPYDEAMRIDSIANETVPALDIERFLGEGDACGKAAILTLMHIALEKGWKGKLLDYRNSGDTAGPKTGVVGYGCYAFYEV